LVVAHDPRINPTICSGFEALPSRLLRDLTYQQLRGVDCGSRRHPDFPQQVPVPGARMPRLEQVLDLLLAHPGVGLNIEIKTFPDHRGWTRPPEDFAAALVAAVSERDHQRRATVQSFDPAALQAVSRLAPRLRLAALADARQDFDRMLQATGARTLSPRYTKLRQTDVSHYRRSGIRVIPWTVNRPRDMRRLVAWGVHGIITDRPGLPIDLLREK
jgi:glycerophosphoryl diester phosphodiesterase